LYLESSRGCKELVLLRPTVKYTIAPLHLFLQTDGYLGDTALIAASRRGYQQIVRLLLEKNADVSVAGWSRETAIDIASSKGHKQVVRMLREYGAQSDIIVLDD
jgi:hypothetical protein